MIPRASSNVLRRSTLLAAAFVAVISAFSAPRYALAVGEPTVTISMDRLALTAGATSGVVFTFSSAPVGFDNGDVDLSNTHGLLSTVTPSADPRIWNAVFTPNEGVNDDTNTVIVGIQWTDGGGVAPLAPAESANFTIHTATSGGSACPEPSVTLAAPNGGETLDAGQRVDVFWTANGCQVESMQLALSVDDGGTYAAPFATVASPFNGYYLWTVPDVGAGAARLRATLIGQGGVVLATDATDGPFAITPAATAAVAEPAPPPAPSSPATETTAAPAVAPPAPTPDTGSTTAIGSPPAEPAPPPDPAAPAPPPTPRVKPGPSAILVSAAPLAASTQVPPQEQIPQPVQPMTNANDNQALTVERAQGAVEAASGYVPSPLEMAYSFVAGAVSMLAFVLGAQKVLRDKKLKNTKPCRHCRGTGRDASEQKGPGTCGDCSGTGFVEEEEEESGECPHCKGEGEDPCHECKGTGEDASGNECAACKGGGKTLEDPEDEEPEVAECEVCGGEGEVGTTIKKQTTCEKCGGTGKV